jgi:tetratricopeptide (TPR) repeat protein
VAPFCSATLVYFYSALDRSESVDLFREVLRERPESSDAHRDLALALADSNHLPEALQESTQAVALAPGSGSAHSARGLILYGLNRMDDAAKEFAAATKYSPNLPDAWFYWALIQTANGDAPAATRSLQRVVALQPRNARAYALLAKSLDRQSRPVEAREAWHHALAINPDESETVYMAARAMGHSDPAESKRLLAHFLELQKNKEENDRVAATVSSLGNQAYVAMQAEKWAAARELLDQAVTACGQCSLIGACTETLA